MYCNVCNKYIKSSKKLKYHVSSLSVVYSIVVMNTKKYLK